MSKVLVTGATGYVGTHLVRHLLNKGYEVSVTLRESSQLTFSSDINEQLDLVTLSPETTAIDLVDALQKIKPDVVVHLASLYISEHSSDQIESLINSNVLFGGQLLEAMDKCGCMKLVNIGTSWQHYNDEKYAPVNLYAATKQALLDIIKYYSLANGFQVVDLKLYDTYGLEDKRKKLIPFLIQNIGNCRALDMSLGEQRINIVHIDDVVNCLEIAISRLNKNLVNEIEEYAVGADQVLSLRELVMLIEKKADHSILINWGGRKYRRREVMVPWGGGERLPGWEPKVSLEKGLEMLIKVKVK